MQSNQAIAALQSGWGASPEQDDQLRQRRTLTQITPVLVEMADAGPAMIRTLHSSAYLAERYVGPGSPRRVALLALAWIGCGLIAPLAVQPTSADEFHCPGIPALASGWTADDAEEICTSMRVALAVLQELGLPPTRGLIALPLDDTQHATDGHPIGEYDARKGQVRVLPYAVARDEWREGRSGYGVPFSRAMWRGFVAHETAHAVADPYFAPGIERQSASEYIAAVVQFSALARATRDQLLAQNAGAAGWNSEAEITLTYYMLDPARYAVKSYRHYQALAPADRLSFVRHILQKGLPD